MIGKTISQYQILEKLGEGGMGVVYKAHDTKLDRIVALKFLPFHLTTSDTDKARFLQEAKAAAALNHPNVCTIHEIHDEGNNTFIVMEYVEGKTLWEIVQDNLPNVLNIREIMDIAIQIAEALKAAHSKGVIHCDIKSENIMCTETGQVKVMDFGLAKLRGSAKLTKTSSTVGTLAYMSPEHLEGKDVDARSDIFSFGVVLYEMLTGQLPFKGEYDSAIMYSIVNENPQPIQKYRSDLSSEWLHVQSRSLEKDYNERYQSVDDMLIDLKRLKRDTNKVSSESLKQMPVTEKNTKVGKLKKRYWIGIAAAAVFMVLILWFVSQKLFRKNQETLTSRENSIAVMYFENRSGEDNFGKILTDMLTSNLSRCKQINVVSSQHLFDILKRMGKEDIETIDRSVATDVATNARVRTMLLGSIYKIGTTLNVNAQLCDVQTGSVIGPAQAQGGNVQDIYQMVNKLTEDVIRLMEISRPADSQPLKINDVTTYSFEAYKHYQKGMEDTWRWNWQDGQKEFQEAVNIDTTFAMAHCYLAFSTGVFKVANPLSNLSSERENMRLANKYSKKATDRERDIIHAYSAFIDRDYYSFLTRAKELAENYPNEKVIYFRLGTANYFTGNYQQSVEAYNKVLEIDPKHADAYNMLSYNYSNMNEHEKAISAVRNYIALLPDVSNTHDTAFEIYLMAGQYDNAYQVCEEALKINPQWTKFKEYESYIYLFRGEGDRAREKNRDISKLDPSWELYLVDDLGCFNMYEGRYREAAVEFQKGVNLAHNIKNTESEIYSRLVLGKFYCVMGEFSKAIKEFSEVKKLSKEIYGKAYNTWPVRADYHWGVTAIHQGDYDEALAIAERIKNYIVSNHYDDILMDYYYLLYAKIHLKKAQLTAVTDMINRISQFTRRNFPRYRMLTADLLVLQGKLENAIHVYQEFYNDWQTTRTSFGGDFFDYFMERSKVHYRIALLYEKLGNSQQAIFYYQKALNQWKNANEDLSEFVDTKKRMTKLTGKN